jgi:hypothetical protein
MRNNCKIYIALFISSLFIAVLTNPPNSSATEEFSFLKPTEEESAPQSTDQTATDIDIPTTISTDMEDKPVVRIRILNKITAVTRSYNLNVGDAVSFDGLNIQPRRCMKAPPVASPESAAFLEIWEKDVESKESEWVFSGWMFASSPGLSAMDHPVYDVWVLDCLNKKQRKKKTTSKILKDDDSSSKKQDSAPQE